jgi:hypothetical protein
MVDTTTRLVIPTEVIPECKKSLLHEARLFIVLEKQVYRYLKSKHCRTAIKPLARRLF